jgi:hypothetical protein
LDKSLAGVPQHRLTFEKSVGNCHDLLAVDFQDLGDE